MSASGQPHDHSPDALLRWAADRHAGRLAFATSLGREDQVVLDRIVALGLREAIPVFTLDTGRLFPETVELVAANERRYGVRIQVFAPEAAVVEDLVARQGILGLRDSLANREECCRVRKLQPLARALAGRTAWICGLRSGQGATRASVAPWSRDAEGRVKVCPLHAWSSADVDDYVARHRVPVNPLHAQGMPSIGCACCTRAIAPGEDERAGRWWWENPEHRECGLHRRPVSAGARA
jgi:phosphoadenosine phosphosulfate reductase